MSHRHAAISVASKQKTKPTGCLEAEMEPLQKARDFQEPSTAHRRCKSQVFQLRQPIYLNSTVHLRQSPKLGIRFIATCNSWLAATDRPNRPWRFGRQRLGRALQVQGQQPLEDFFVRHVCLVVGPAVEAAATAPSSAWWAASSQVEAASNALRRHQTCSTQSIARNGGACLVEPMANQIRATGNTSGKHRV